MIVIIGGFIRTYILTVRPHDGKTICRDTFEILERP